MWHPHDNDVCTYNAHTESRTAVSFVKENNYISFICLILLSWAEAAVALVKAVNIGLIPAESKSVVCVFLQFTLVYKILHYNTISN